jgi:hypothetical protein
MVNSTALTQPIADSLEAYEHYVADLTDFFGDSLLMNGTKGGWTAGRDKREIPNGTQLVAIINQTMVGFQRWVDGRPERSFLPLSSDPDLKQLRESLGDTDTDAWEERTLGGAAKDPWSSAIMIPFVDPKTTDCFTFMTTSGGGVRGAKRLIRACVRQIRAAPETTSNHLPLVALGQESYTPKINKGVTFFAPMFEVVDWVPTSSIADALRANGYEMVGHDLEVEPEAA